MHLLPTLIFAATEAAEEAPRPAGRLRDPDPAAPGPADRGLRVHRAVRARLQAAFGRWAAEIVPVGVIVATWLVALAIIWPALNHLEPFGEHGNGTQLWTWIPAGDLQVQLGLHVDALTAALLLVVTTIGMLVHLYSVGYMAHDRATWRFFAYLNLFMFSMLVLVLADNWLLVFAGWELVGLSSLQPHRVLVPQALGRPGRQEGVHRQPRRRRRVRARDHGDLRQHRDAGHPGLPRDDDRARGRERDPAHDRRAAGVRRRHGQERPVPAPRLAPGRDGGPDPRLGPDPRGHDGQRRRLPRGPRRACCSRSPRRRWSWSRRSASSPRSSRPRSRSPRPTSSACSRSRRCPSWATCSRRSGSARTSRRSST